MNIQRYQIRRYWRNPKDGNQMVLCYRVVDTHIIAPDWDESAVFESPDAIDCVDECNRLNEQEKTTRQ